MEKSKSAHKSRKPAAKGKRSGKTATRSAKTGRFVSKSYKRSTPRASTKSTLTPASGGFGCAKGLIEIGPDFDEPLDEFESHL